ncbi:cysteine hydrolase family protein [Dongia sp.]|uniref:cysteine hydrolase family protein n=1 Tax=Dongia sp. TaxID=1977262 RepID=UPI0035B102EA
MSWKTRNRSFYYQDAPEPEDLNWKPAETALLVIDVQNTYLERPDRAGLDAAGQAAYDAWTPFHRRMNEMVIPRTAAMLALARKHGIECLFARIACQTGDGRDRSLSQKMPGWNNLLLPKTEHASQLVPQLAPQGDEIIVTKTTDSALTGTNLRLILHNLGIRNVICAGIFTDQCVASTVRSLADESFQVVVLEDCCAAGTDALHEQELAIINMIYCHVMNAAELTAMLRLT